MSTLLNEEGATKVEYALLVALIAIACVLVVGQFGLDAERMFAAIREAMQPRDGNSNAGI